MATSKKTQIKEDLRVMGEPVPDAAPEVTVRWLTPEFWTMAIAAATNLVTVGVLLGWVEATNAESLIKALSAVLAAAQVLVVNTALVWKYLAGRQAVQAQLIAAQMHYREALAIERLRLQK
jgi:hypothetical protein